MTIARNFHGWQTPALPAAVDLLTREWRQRDGQGPLDLRGCLILVPTRQAGRRLRAELARVAEERNTAVLSGAIVTPEHLIPLPAETAPDPLVLAVLAQRLLVGHQNGQVRALLPFQEAEWTLPVALGIARQIQDVRRQLAEGDQSAADLLPVLPDDEIDRWKDIAALEKYLRQDLRKLGVKDPFESRRELARRTPTATAYTRVVSLFVPDLSPLAARALESLSATCAVELHVLAPESEADRFDAWGRPIPDQWENEPLPIGENQIHVFEQAPDETDALAVFLQEADRRDRALAICTPDPGNARALARRLQMDNRPLYLPNGVPLSATAPGRLLAAWLALLRQRDYASVAAFMRHPDTRDWFGRQLGLADASTVLAELDDCQGEHLPATFDDLCHFAKAHNPDSSLARALAEVERHFGDSLPVFLADLYDCRNPSPAAPPDPLFVEAAQSLAGLIDSTAESARRLRLDANTTLDLLLAALAGEQVFPRPNSSVVRETTGWLEVQWEATPALLLADMREGVVPETRIGDAFLPDGIRARAGLPGNREAFARDLFLARALLESRPPGAVRFLYSRRAANQDPQLPSRILLACPDSELPGRIALLFERPALRAPAASAPPLPSLRLAPPACAPGQIPAELSVTAFRAYLDCPFCFYLQHVLGMQAADDGARELDPSLFGNLAHATLRALRKYPDLADEDQLAGLLLAELDRLAKRQFGARPPLALLVQLSSLRQRLRAAAAVHATSVRAGWRILATEEKFETELDGLRVRARIDRIDRNADGQIRILDYKTSDAGKSPFETHYRTGLKAWEDLQLPLYRYVYEKLHPGSAPVAVGYFNLPKAAADARIDMLDFNHKGTDLYPSALETVRRVVADIRAGRFWPPAERSDGQTAFALLFAGNPPLIQKPGPP